MTDAEAKAAMAACDHADLDFLRETQPDVYRSIKDMRAALADREELIRVLRTLIEMHGPSAEVISPWREAGDLLRRMG